MEELLGGDWRREGASTRRRVSPTLAAYCLLPCFASFPPVAIRFHLFPLFQSAQRRLMERGLRGFWKTFSTACLPRSWRVGSACRNSRAQRRRVLHSLVCSASLLPPRNFPPFPTLTYPSSANFSRTSPCILSLSPPSLHLPPFPTSTPLSISSSVSHLSVRPQPLLLTTPFLFLLSHLLPPPPVSLTPLPPSRARSCLVA